MKQRPAASVNEIPRRAGCEEPRALERLSVGHQQRQGRRPVRVPSPRAHPRRAPDDVAARLNTTTRYYYYSTSLREYAVVSESECSIRRCACAGGTGTRDGLISYYSQIVMSNLYDIRLTAYGNSTYSIRTRGPPDVGRKTRKTFVTESGGRRGDERLRQYERPRFATARRHEGTTSLDLEHWRLFFFGRHSLTTTRRRPSHRSYRPAL